MRIVSILENQNIEKRIAITPEIAKKYKIKSYKTIASSNFRLKERMKENRKIKKQYAMLKETCS